MKAQQLLNELKGETIYWTNFSSGSADGLTKIDDELIESLDDAEVLTLDKLPNDVYEAITNELNHIDKMWKDYPEEFRVIRSVEGQNNHTYFLVWIK